MFNFDVNQILGMLSQQGYTGGLLGQVQNPGESVSIPPRPVGAFGRQAQALAGLPQAGQGVPNEMAANYSVPQRPAMQAMNFYRRPDFGGLFGGFQGGGVGAPTVPTPGIKRDPSNPVVY